MKSDTERKKRYAAKNHKKKDFLNVHLSKELKEKMKQKRRALLVNKGDTVKVMIGSKKGKTGKVARVSHVKIKVYIEGLTVRNAKGDEKLIAFQPSNLMIIEVEPSKERMEIFKELPKPKKEVKKPEVKKVEEKKSEAKPAEKKPEAKPKEEKKPVAKPEVKPEPKKEVKVEKPPEPKAPEATKKEG